MRNAGSLLSLHQVGRRRGGNKLALKTGVVAKKQKTDEEVKMGGERGAVDVAQPPPPPPPPPCSHGAITS